MQFTFLYPRFLLLLLLVPFFILVYFFAIAYNKKKSIVFANFEAMERFYDIEFFSKNFIALYINLAVLILLIFSLAGVGVSFQANTSDFSYVIAIDTSSSMGATDVYPSRLAVATSEAKNFIDSLPVGVEIGVIGFSGDAVVLQKLDTSKIKSKIALDEVDFGKIQGTNIYNALVAANKMFGLKQRKSVVLISDGQLNVGDAPQIIRYLNRNNIVVNTIAVGTPEGGVTKFNTVSKLDANFLKSLAFNSDGEFFSVENATELKTSLSTLVDEVNMKVDVDLSLYFLIAAILIFTVLWILYNLRLKVVP